MQLVYANKSTLPTQQVGGYHYHISTIINPALYTTLSTTAWVNPTNLELYPTIPTNSTMSHREYMQLHLDEVHKFYYNEGTINEALNNQGINTFKNMYLKELKNKYIRFLRVTCQNILEHIFDWYGNILTKYLEANSQQMDEFDNHKIERHY